MAKNITKKSENYSQWYNDIVLNADLVEFGPDLEDVKHMIMKIITT